MSADGWYAWVTNPSSEATADYAFATGFNNTASGEAALAGGAYSESKAIDGLAFGQEAYVASSGSYSGICRAALALGYETYASGTTAFAANAGAVADYTWAIALGFFTASGSEKSLATGIGTTCTAHDSLSGGYKSLVTDSYAGMAVGMSCRSKHYYSSAIGFGADTTYMNQLAIGRLHVEHTHYPTPAPLPSEATPAPSACDPALRPT